MHLKKETRTDLWLQFLTISKKKVASTSAKTALLIVISWALVSRSQRIMNGICLYTTVYDQYLLVLASVSHSIQITNNFWFKMMQQSYCYIFSLNLNNSFLLPCYILSLLYYCLHRKLWILLSSKKWNYYFPNYSFTLNLLI